MAAVLDLVKHYQRVIEKYPQDEQRVLKAIEKLYNLDVKVQHLQDTGVGRTVNALRKEPGDIGPASRALVYKWKVMVAEEESDQESDHETIVINNSNEKDSDDNGNLTKSTQEKCEKSISTPKLDLKDYKRINGNTSGSKRKYQSSEEEEPETKKLKHSSSSETEDYKRKHVQVKLEPPESDSQGSYESQSDDSDSEISASSTEEHKNHKIKTEPSDYHKSPSKHSSHTHGDVKKESSSHKSYGSTHKHSKHHSSESRHSSENSSSKDKIQIEKKSKETENSEKKHKSDHKSSDKEKRHKKSKSSSKHSSDKHKSSSRKTDSSPEKHKSQSDKSNSEKHNSFSSHKYEKEKHKGSSVKDVAIDKHKSKDSSSSKEKSSSSKEKSKDRSSSSKEKSSSHKSDKKHSSPNDKSKSSDSKNKVEKSEDKDSSKKSSHKSRSSSSHKSKSSNSKSKEDIPKITLNANGDSDDDGIDCGSGASFADVLGMIVPSKSKKKSTPIKDANSPNNSNNDLSPAALLAPTAKLAPLPALEISALPEISPNYKPRPPPKFLPHFSDEDAMSAVISSKNQRTKVYSGNKIFGRVPSLYEMCVQILQEHIDALEYTGGVPYEILKPVVDKGTPQQLFMLEHHNPYLMEDTDHLWEKHCEKHFRNKKRQEMETWREMYLRCQEEQEYRLKSLTANIRMTQEAKKAPIKQTKMAYVDSVVKPPRNIARKQALHGTAHTASASPAARVAALAKSSNVLKGGVRPSPAAPVSSSSFMKPKKAPLMQKALQFMRGRKR